MEVFFYGLFMDENILNKYGLKPRDVRKARLDDYVLKIGNRASLLPSNGDTAYGLLIKVDKEATTKLYNEASVEDYIPEEVKAITQAGEVIKAFCYNLPAHSLSGTNSAYARSLYKLAKRLDFPEAYLEHIRKMA